MPKSPISQNNGVESSHKIQGSEDRFRFMLNAIPQQVSTATADGALNYVNQVVSNDFGYSPEAVVGHG